MKNNKSTTGSFFGDIIKATKAGGASSMTKTLKAKKGDTLSTIAKTNNITLAKLMKLNPKSCYSIHEDPDARYHIAILTNPKAKFVFTKKEKLFHIPADEHLYWVDTREEHTFINGSLDSSRLHLIMGYDNDIL